MKVAGYVRVSTPKQKEEDAHERQKERLQDWADSQEEEIELEIFQDIAISGQNPERHRYQELMDSLEEYDAVVVRDLSRLGRSLKQLIDDIEEMGREDVEFISLQENLDTSTAQGKLLFQIIGAFSEFYANQKREETMARAQRYQEDGKGWGRPQKLDEDIIVNQLLPDRRKGISYNALAKIYREHTDKGKLSPATVRSYIQEYGEEGVHYGEGYGEDNR